MKKLVITFAAAAGLMSCASVLPHHPETGEISIALTKAGAAESGYGDSDMTFGISAHLGEAEPYTADYVWNAKVSVTGGTPVSECPLYRMDGMPIRFYAYMPYAADSDTCAAVSISGPGEVPEIRYRACEDASGHIDIRTAEGMETDGTVSLVFHHILAGIRIVKGKEFDESGSIEAIRAVGVTGSGSYNMVSGTWSLTGERRSFHASDTDMRFLLPPQVFDDDTRLEIAINDSGRTISGAIPLAGMIAEAGHLYTFSVTYTAGRLDISSTESFIAGPSFDLDDSSEYSGHQ